MRRSIVRSTLVPCALLIGGGFVAIAPALATNISINGNTADAEVNSNAVGDGSGASSNSTKNGTLLAGTFNTATMISPVFVFQLPTLSPGETIASANLDVHANRAGTTAFNADLYGLPARASATVLGSDYFVGTLDTTNATLIQNDEFTPSTSTTAGTIGTSVSGDAALATYLQAQYDGGNAGNFVFLRFSPDFTSNSGFPSSTFGYPISSAETTTPPVLTFTTVPEPSTAAVLGMVTLLGVLRRRRQV